MTVSAPLARPDSPAMLVKLYLFSILSKIYIVSDDQGSGSALWIFWSPVSNICLTHLSAYSQFSMTENSSQGGK